MSIVTTRSVVTLALLGLGASLAHPADAPRPPERLYAISCHYCHDTGIGTMLFGAQLDPQRIRLAVRQGYMAMPAFAPSFITDAELTALAAMLSQAPAPAAAGRP
ncbi:MAG: cytochrome c [Gammaproteobacteria bacterium]|nr:cytochrome c [Gammaproteobacteria bacterium]